MDRSQWARNPGKVHSALSTQPDGSVLAIRDVKVYIPVRFTEKELATVGAEVYTVAIFAMVVDDKYMAVSTVNAMIRLKPSAIATVKFDGDSYLELSFPAGSVVIADTKVLRQDSLPYMIFDELISKGRVPWYINYEDLAKLFDTAESHAGVGFDRVHSILEMFAAAISRDPENRTRFYRHVYDEVNGAPVSLPAHIAFRSITHGASNTTSRLMGSYFNEGMTSALVHPSESNEAIEDLLRR